MAPLNPTNDFFVYSDRTADKPPYYGYAQRSFYERSEFLLDEIEVLGGLEHLTERQAKIYAHQLNREETSQ
jgi:hypothetical protein